MNIILPKIYKIDIACPQLQYLVSNYFVNIIFTVHRCNRIIEITINIIEK